MPHLPWTAAGSRPEVQALLFQGADLRQVRVGPRRFFLVDPCNGEADVNQHIISRLDLRGKRQIHRLAHAAKVHAPRAIGGIPVLDAKNFSRDR
jgi:hypothetical protein